MGTTLNNLHPCPVHREQSVCGARPLITLTWQPHCTWRSSCKVLLPYFVFLKEDMFLVNILKICFSARYRCPPFISSTLTQKPHGPWHFIKVELFMLKGIFLLRNTHAVSSGGWNLSVICSVSVSTSLSQTNIPSVLLMAQDHPCLCVGPQRMMKCI